MMMDKSAKQLFQNNEIIIKYLKDSRLFNHLPDDILQQLLPLSNIASYPAGNKILEEEIENDSVFFLMNGTVSIHSGGEEILKLKRIGDMFGEMSVISQKPTMATVIAESNVELFSIKASFIGKNTEIDGDNLKNIFYRLFATILTDKLALTTTKARKFEEMNSELQVVQTQLIKEKNNAEAANLSKSTFLANMSHEVRTPMNGIMGITSLLLETPMPEKQSELIHIIDKSAKSLLKVLNDILDYSKIEAGELDIESSYFHLDGTLKEVFDLVRISVKEKELDFYSRIDTEVPRLIVGDPLRLRQVLLNLVSNSVKFTENGEISVDVSIDNQTEQDISLKMLVKDTGIGIPTDQLNHLFESFSQVDSSSTRRYGGTGLGLAIASQLVKIMGGKLSVQSELGKGCEFWFVLTFKKQKDRRNNEPNSEVINQYLTRADDVLLEVPESVKRKTRILLVEDDKINQMVALFTLKRLGFDIDAVENGKDCISALENVNFDIIFMDLQMPELDGFETTHVIRDKKSLVKNHKVPIIAMTAHAMKGDKERCIKEGMDDYISKPVNQNELNVILNRWLGTNKNTKTSSKTDESFETIIDIATYKNLERSIGDIKYIVAAFIKDLPGKVDNMRQAIKDNDATQIELIAHALKANCNTLGILKLGEFCKEIEHLGSIGDFNKSGIVWERIKVESLKVIQILKEEI